MLKLPKPLLLWSEEPSWQPSLPSWDGAGNETIGPAQTSLCYKPGMLTWLQCLTVVTSDLLSTVSFFEISIDWSADVIHADNKPCDSLQQRVNYGTEPPNANRHLGTDHSWYTSIQLYIASLRLAGLPYVQYFWKRCFIAVVNSYQSDEQTVV